MWPPARPPSATIFTPVHPVVVALVRIGGLQALQRLAEQHRVAHGGTAGGVQCCNCRHCSIEPAAKRTLVRPYAFSL